MSTKPGLQRLGEVLSDFFEAKGLTGRLKHLEVYSAWEEVVGPAMSPHTRIAGLAKHKLYVEVDSAAHLHELRTFHKKQLLQELQARVPSILVRDIIFRLSAPGGRSEHV